jgi:peptide/nickel transport system permease protein
VSAESIAEGSAGRRAGTVLHELVRQPLLWVVMRRLLLTVPLLFLVSVLTFVLVSITPGDAATEILGANAPPEAYDRLRHSLGLDLPLHEQYWRWLRHALGGDLGTSLFTGERVTEAIDARLPVTLSLIVVSLLVQTVLGVGLGMLSATRGGAVGRAVDAFFLVGFALPAFWVGTILISLFAVRLHWLPAVGYVPLADSPRDWARSLVMPVIALSLHSIAALVKQTREAMLDALGSEYVRMARASGIAPWSILFQHAFKNAAIRVVTILGLLTIGLLGGTVIVESVFALPGVGSLAVTASIQHDLPLVQGIVVYFTVIVVVVNLTVDLAYTWLNPRVRAH